MTSPKQTFSQACGERAESAQELIRASAALIDEWGDAEWADSYGYYCEAARAYFAEAEREGG